jgi:hypothetical protein
MTGEYPKVSIDGRVWMFILLMTMMLLMMMMMMLLLLLLLFLSFFLHSFIHSFFTLFAGEEVMEVPKPTNLPPDMRWRKYCLVSDDWRKMNPNDFLEKADTGFLDFVSVHIKVCIMSII